MLVAVFGMVEPLRQSTRRLLRGLEDAVGRVSSSMNGHHGSPFGPPPRWGPLAMTPRDAFLGPHDTAYGLREFVYIDPDGVVHKVGSPL